MTTSAGRRTILITHANPEDNAFASWLASRLIAAGYDAWIDIQALRGGNDFWHVIDRKLRDDAIKQIVCVSKHVGKDGVQKEIAVGNIVRKTLNDPDFVIPIRVDETPFAEFPIEFVRQNGLNAYPNWAECLEPLLKTLSEAQVPRLAAAETGLLGDLVAAREAGRRAILNQSEQLVTNWFPFTQLPAAVTFLTGKGTNEQFSAWLSNHPLPHVPVHRLAAVLCAPEQFAAAHSNPIDVDVRYTLPFDALVQGTNLGPFSDVATARRTIVNLLRQHWDRHAERRGLKPFVYANKEVGWFFPDGLVIGPARVTIPNGERLSRVFSGKFKDRRWHLCLLAKPRLFPTPVMRVHANLVLSLDGHTALAGDVTHKLRRRLTRSWWNDKWRDLLLTGMGWLANGKPAINLATGEEGVGVASYPLEIDIPASFAATEELPTEERPDGEIITSDELNTPFDGDLDGEEPDGEGP